MRSLLRQNESLAPPFECQAFEFPTTHLPYGGSCFERRIVYINNACPYLCSIFQEKDVLHSIRKNTTMSTKKIRKGLFSFEKIFSHSSKAEGIHPFQIEKIDNKFEALQRTRASGALLDGLMTDEVIARIKV